MKEMDERLCMANKLKFVSNGRRQKECKWITEHIMERIIRESNVEVNETDCFHSLLHAEVPQCSRTLAKNTHTCSHEIIVSFVLCG